MEATWRMRGRLRGADEARLGFKTADERGPLDLKRIERPRLKSAGFFHLASTAARVAAARGGNSPEKLAGARPGEGGRRGSS